MSDSMTLLAAVLGAGYGLLLLVLVLRRRTRRDAEIQWLLVTLVVALIGTALIVLPADAHTDDTTKALFVAELTQPAVSIIVANLMLVLFGFHLLRFLGSRLDSVWLVAGLIWWAAQAGITATTENLSIGTEGWYRYVYDPVEWPNTLAFAGWLVLGVLLMLAALYAFYRAPLPEIANRALFAELLIIPVFAGVVVGASDEKLLAEAGRIIQWIGLALAVYGVVVYRLIDIRRTVRNLAATGVLTTLTALVIFIALIIAQELDPATDGLYAILAALALGVAVAYLPFRIGVQAVMMRVFGRSPESISQKLRQFSDDITAAVELDDVMNVTMRTLAQVLRVRRGGLVLISEGVGGALDLEPVEHGLGDLPDVSGQLAANSPIHTRLARDRSALLQYDLDSSTHYADAPAAERQFFRSLGMSAYAPVVVQNRLVGLVCCGSKTSDDPFTDEDLELMITIANQTGVALRNARLVTDLRRREKEQAALTREMAATKAQVERLDSVKTDFITIASHELRTPLAQIRGYTDIMEAMNEQGMLDQDQVGGMTRNLRKAADRLEELIGAMLDVSQLDVDAMDLRFSQVSVESCMRSAIEPLTEAIKNRRLMLSARGLRDLPRIEGDMQRLVQAFRNVVLNAIKYTPDGGRIDISGHLEDDEIHVTIKDSGIGIDPKNHELIFEKFFRAHDPSLHSTGATKFMGAGPGLGLTIARGVITAHGGRIWVESDTYDPDTMPGSTFIIALPLVPPEEEARVSPFESTVSLDVAGLQDLIRQPGDRLPIGAEDIIEPPTLPKPPAGLREG